MSGNHFPRDLFIRIQQVAFSTFTIKCDFFFIAVEKVEFICLRIYFNVRKAAKKFSGNFTFNLKTPKIFFNKITTKSSIILKISTKFEQMYSIASECYSIEFHLNQCRATFFRLRRKIFFFQFSAAHFKFLYPQISRSNVN